MQTPTPYSDENPRFCQVPSYVTPMLITGVSHWLTCSCKPSSKEMYAERICTAAFWRVCCPAVISDSETYKIKHHS